MLTLESPRLSSLQSRPEKHSHHLVVHGGCIDLYRELNQSNDCLNDDTVLVQH